MKHFLNLVAGITKTKHNKKLRITQADFLLANRRASREEEILPSAETLAKHKLYATGTTSCPLKGKVISAIVKKLLAWRKTSK